MGWAGIGGEPGQGQRRDQPGRQRGAPAGRDVVQLGEEGGRAARGGDADLGGRGADHLDRRVQRPAVESGELAGDLQGRAAEGGREGPEARNGRQRGGGAAGGSDDRLGAPAEGDVGALGRGGTVQAGIGIGDHGLVAALHPRDAPGAAQAGGRREPESGAGVRPSSAQVVVEPSGHLVAEVGGDLVRGRGVVPTGVPDNLHGGAVRRDAPRVGIGLAQAEQGVLGALDQQRRRGDPVEHPGRAAAVEHGGDLRCERPGGRGGLVRGADVGSEATAGQCLLHGGRIRGGRVHRGTGGATARATPTQRIEQAATRRRAETEEDPGPQSLVDTGVATLGSGGDGLRIHNAGLGGEEGRRQRAPRDLRRDGVDAVVVGGAEEGERPAVRAAGHPDPGIAWGVELDVVPGGEPVDQRREVRDLVARVVQPDLAGAAAESAGRVGEDDVAARGEVTGVAGDGILAAAEAVREDHRGSTAGAGRQIGRGVEFDGVRAGTGGHHRRPRCGSPPRRADGATTTAPASMGRASRAASVARAPERGRGRTSPRRERTLRPTDERRDMFRRGSASGQGVQSPVRTTTRPGAVTSDGSSKKRTAGPCSCGNASTSWTAAWRCVSSPSVKNTVLAATSSPV